MPAWNQSEMITLYSERRAGDKLPCDVRIDSGEILVTYKDLDGSSAVYRGKEIGSGHFELKMDGGGGHASLHQFPNSQFLEGWWNEDEVGEGAWRIILSHKK